MSGAPDRGATAGLAAPAPKSKPYRWLKPLALAAGLTPLAVITTRFFLGALGANPIVLALNQMGLWTLILLLACLTCTPLKILFDWNWPPRIRRVLGLLTFFYGFVHFGIYVGLDQGLAWDEIWKDLVKRKFMTVGFLALVLMAPLAITSTNKMIKRMGFRRWKRLHRLTYVAAAAAIVHFVWRVKADLREPLIYAGVLLALLLVRVGAFLRERAAPGSS